MATMTKLQERWEAISPREQRLIMVLGITFVVVIFAFIGMQISKGLNAIAERNESTRLALRALAAYRLSKQEPQAGPQVEIPDEPEKLNTYLEGIAGEVGITIPEFIPVNPTTRNGYTETSRRIELRRVTIQELKDFLHKVETRSQVVVIQSMEIKRQLRDKDKLDVTMVVATYSKAAPESKDKDKPGEEG